VAEKLFAEATTGKVGFVVRPRGWVFSRLRQWKMKPDDVFIDRGGYACTDPDPSGRRIYEFAARNRAAYVRLLGRIIAATRGGLVDYYVRDPILRAIYKKRGARFRRKTYSSLMVKPLTRVTFRSVFGSRFFQSPVDQYCSVPCPQTTPIRCPAHAGC